MIERIYLDNIRSFVNFEKKPGPLTNQHGDNGSGKTSLIDTLASLKYFLAGEPVGEKFPATSRTRWEERKAQKVELDVRGQEGLYRYQLVIEHDENSQDLPVRVERELLHYEDKLLVEFIAGNLRLFDDKGGGLNFDMQPTKSGVGAISPSRNARLLAGFRDFFKRMRGARPDPRAMTARIADRAPFINQNLSNFYDLYLHHISKNPRAIFKALQALSQVLPGFNELFEEQGLLQARFGHGAESRCFRFDELSDGQRALIALYVFRYVWTNPGEILIIDEPDNYVSLREIQPWLTEITELALAKNGPQVWLISHHPEVLNLLANEYGWRFFRDGNGPTRVERFKSAPGLKPSETAARGWDGD